MCEPLIFGCCSNTTDPGKEYCKIIADDLSKAGWSWGCVSAVDSGGPHCNGVDLHLAEASLSLESHFFEAWMSSVISRFFFRSFLGSPSCKACAADTLPPEAIGPIDIVHRRETRQGRVSDDTTLQKCTRDNDEKARRLLAHRFVVDARQFQPRYPAHPNDLIVFPSQRQEIDCKMQSNSRSAIPAAERQHRYENMIQEEVLCFRST
jgi:hypothetical protein